jgi:hypothetical protein
MADLNISGIAQLGSNLSSSVDLQAETCRKARRNGFPKLVSLINSTSSTLQKVHELSQQSPDVFTQVCVNDINGLASTCRVLYEGILFLLVNRDENQEDGKEVGRMKQDQVESLLSSLMHKNFSGDKTWEWLDPRLEICQQELKQVKFELTLRFLLGSIAKFQLRFVSYFDSPLAEETNWSLLALQCVPQAIGRMNVRYDSLLRTLLKKGWHTTRGLFRKGRNGQIIMKRHFRPKSLSKKKEVWSQIQVLSLSHPLLYR